MVNVYVFLKNKNIIFKIRISKVTDYAALIIKFNCISLSNLCRSMEPDRAFSSTGYISAA